MLDRSLGSKKKGLSAPLEFGQSLRRREAVSEKYVGEEQLR